MPCSPLRATPTNSTVGGATGSAYRADGSGLKKPRAHGWGRGESSQAPQLSLPPHLVLNDVPHALLLLHPLLMLLVRLLLGVLEVEVR